MLGRKKARGYSLEMICADFLAGATLGEAKACVFLASVRSLVELLSGPERNELIQSLKDTA
jgi:hypothetical protein